jgi:hypothetical protein
MANKNKSTHQGHCQACSRIQMLPEGKLAKHGYQVAGFGFFNGICMGSGHLPLEQDKTIVEASIVWAEGVIERKEAEIASYSTWRGEHMAWFHDYIPSKRRGIPSGYKWIYTPVGRYTVGSSDHAYPYTFLIDHEGKVVDGLRYSLHAASTQELVEKMNAKYIDALRHDIEQAKRYIADQRRLIRDWHLQPLIVVWDRVKS